MADAPALVFSIARLTTPTLELGLPDRFVLEQDLVTDGQALQHARSPPAPAATGFAGRVQADAAHPAGGTGGGLLKLPQSFGSVYLGQSFSAIVTACNFSGAPLALVGIKVELSTERSRLALLYDSTAQPLPHLQPGQRHDFAIRHDVKDLGAHSLTCSATYLTVEGERRQQAQAFSFSAANPLVVRTKQRHVGAAVLLEAALENATRDPMLLDTITFLPSPAYAVERIGGGGASSTGSGMGTAAAAAAAELGAAAGEGAAAEAAAAAGPLSVYIQSLPLMPPGGSMAFLFRLTKAAAAAGGSSNGNGGGGAAPTSAPAPSGALGKIEIRWRGPMGQMARLQTQLISLPPQQGVREVSLELARLPVRVSVGVPFTATLRVASHIDRGLGPLKVVAAASGELPSPSGSPPRLGRLSGSVVAEPGHTPPRSGSGSTSREASVHAQAAAVGAAAAAAGGASPAVRRSASSSVAAGSPTAAAAAAAHAVCMDGPQEVLLAELAPRQEAEVQLRLLALAAGQHALPALALVGEQDGRQYALLPPVDLFVDSGAASSPLD